MAFSLIDPKQIDGMCRMAASTPPGVFVEFGVYQGGSALALSEVAAQQGRELHLFDTFTGIPYAGPEDQHNVGDFADTNEIAVRALIPSAIFHVGTFPQTMPKKFPRVAFLHIDADQYESYTSAIERFSPLMVRGGVMWFDDVGYLASADKAVKEAFGDRVEVSDCYKHYVRF